MGAKWEVRRVEQPGIYRYDVVDSTNTVCKELAAQGAPDGTAVVAGQQTAGRGRLGRGFESPPGMGLYLSMLWRPVASPEGLLPLTAMAAACAARARRRVTRGPVGHQWPHHRGREGRELAGRLTESALTGSGGVDYVVIGLGVNLRQRPEDFSPEVAALATSLAAQGYPVDEPVLTEALADALRQALRHLCAPETYVDEYRQMCLTLGRQVRLLPAQEQVTALDIDGQYGLVVRRQDGTTETLRCGEVSVRGLYGYAE